MSDGQSAHSVGGVWLPSMNMTKAAQGMEYLGGGENATGSSVIGPITFRPRDVLIIIGRVSSMLSTDIPALRFNNDSGTNYWTRNLQAAAGGATFAETALMQTTMLRISALFGISARSFMLILLNRSAASKSATFQSSLATGNPATPGALQIGAGEWVNTTSNVQAVTMLTVGGAQFGIDSGFGVFGKDLGP